MSSTVPSFPSPYVIFLGSETDPRNAKTGRGLLDWSSNVCAGQLRLPGGAIDLGMADVSVEDALRLGARSVVIGVTAVGGRMQPDWIAPLAALAAGGLTIVSGLHNRLADYPQLVEAARAGGGRLWDVREPPAGLPVGTGKKRAGHRVLTVGTDCASGKKYTALALARAMKARGLDADFRATGQTGIMIAGQGIPIDAVPSDFVSGAAEILAPAAAPDHWDLIEGQGSLWHPGFAAVTLGLLHGAQPEAIVLCHDATRQTIIRYPDFPLPTLGDAIARYLDLGRLTSPHIRCAGVSINTSGLPEDARAACLRAAEDALRLPCVDPLADGADRLVDALLAGAAA